MDEKIRRRDDIMMGQLIQKIADFIDLSNTREDSAIVWRREHDEQSVLWRENLDRRLQPLEDWIKQANWSWKLFIGTVALVGMVIKGWDWIKNHFRE